MAGEVMLVKPIKTEADHQKALAEIERLAAKDPARGTPAGDKLEVLATLVEVYEKEHFPIEQPTPIEAVEFRMDQLGLKRKDVEPYIGSRSKVSEVLAGKRPLTLRMIRALSKGLDIPVGVLVQEPRRELPEDLNIDWTRFPLREMARRGWIDEPVETLQDRAEEIMRNFFEPIDGEDLLSALYRKAAFAERSGRKMDPYALVAWTARVLTLAKKEKAGRYSPAMVTADLMREVTRCSWSQQGPLLAKEYLANRGIKLIIVPHLPRTHLDGSASIASDGHPVIGMSIRHDRLDNFWFVLLHELAHVSRHFEDGPISFVDDLDVASGDKREAEADRMAQEALIPRAIWSLCDRSRMSPGDVRELAAELSIHPAIVAGRCRHEAGNFRLFSKMVGQGPVRKLFADISW